MPKTPKKGAESPALVTEPEHVESVDHKPSPEDRPLERDYVGVEPAPDGDIDQRMAALRRDHEAMGAR